MPIKPDDFDASSARPTNRQGGLAVREAENAIARTKEERAEEERRRLRSHDLRDDITTTPWLRVCLLTVAVGLVLVVSAGPLHRYYLRLVSKQDVTTLPKVPKSGGEHRDNTSQEKPSSVTQIPPIAPVQHPPNVENPLSRIDKFPPTSGTPVRRHVVPSNTADQELAKVQKSGKGLDAASLAEQQAAIERERRRLANERAAIEAEKRPAEAAKAISAPTQTFPANEAKVGVPGSFGTIPGPRPYHGPTSGHLYWEGKVNGTDLIEIEGNRSSSGTLSGDVFPYDVPCMVQTSDPKRVTIATPPSPSNHWNRIVLRIKANGYAKVTITWALP